MGTISIFGLSHSRATLRTLVKPLAVPSIQRDELQRKLIAEKLRHDYSRFYETLVEDAGKDFLKYLYALFMRVYELGYDQKFMSKSEAAHFIPLTHATTRRKYLDHAVRLGFLIFEPNPTDGRSELVKPGPNLEAFVTGEVDQSLADIERIIALTKRAERRTGTG